MLDKIFGKKESGCCCGTRIVGLRQINVGGRSTGIMGLDKTLKEYFQKGYVFSYPKISRKMPISAAGDYNIY